MMVGFAGETEEEFEQTLAYARSIALAKVHVFAYSRRPGTVAYSMPGQVSNAEKERRSRALIAVTEQTRREFLQQQIGLVEPVLFEQEAAPGVWEGYTPNYTPVHLASSQNLAGQVLPVRLTSFAGEYCIGELS